MDVCNLVSRPLALDSHNSVLAFLANLFLTPLSFRGIRQGFCSICFSLFLPDPGHVARSRKGSSSSRRLPKGWALLKRRRKQIVVLQQQTISDDEKKP